MTKKHTKKHVVTAKKYHADFEKVAVELDEICRDRLGDGVIKGGVLLGQEPEIRQQTLSRLLGGFLLGSETYKVAVASRCPAAIHDAMVRCVAIAMSYSKRDTTRKLLRQQKREVEFKEQDGGVCRHFVDNRPEDWPVGAKIEILHRCLNQAVETGKLSPCNASVALLVCDQGIPVRKVAKISGVSTNAVYQQLRRVRGVMSELLDEID